jgi:hypothetical protein
VKAWYTNAESFRSPIRWSSRSDEGNLDLFPQRIVFSGAGSRIEITSINAVSIVNRPVPWPSLVLDNAAFLLLVGVGLTSNYTLEKLPGLAVLMAVVNVVLVFMLRRIKWVEVEYRDGSNQQQFAYFTNGSSFGMARGLGGADELYEAITVGIRQHTEPALVTEEAAADPQVSPANQRGGAWVTCEDCGKKSFWLARQRGKVQKCPHCNGYMDA